MAKSILSEGEVFHRDVSLLKRLPTRPYNEKWFTAHCVTVATRTLRIRATSTEEAEREARKVYPQSTSVTVETGERAADAVQAHGSRELHDAVPRVGFGLLADL